MHVGQWDCSCDSSTDKGKDQTRHKHGPREHFLHHKGAETTAPVVWRRLCFRKKEGKCTGEADKEPGGRGHSV